MQVGNQSNQLNSQGGFRPPVAIRPRPHVLQPRPQQPQLRQVYVHRQPQASGHLQGVAGRPPMLQQNQIQSQPRTVGQCCHECFIFVKH